METALRRQSDALGSAFLLFVDDVVVDTWITDLRHYLTPTGAMATDLPPRARLLAEYFASIVVDATTNIDDPPSVRCRRRPGHRRCSGIIFSVPSIAEDDEDNDPTHWHCPVCHDNGVVTGWQNTLWDGQILTPHHKHRG